MIGGKIRTLRKRTEFYIVQTMGAYPWLYFGARRIVGRMDRECVSGETDIVIEGFPRSANSTFVHGFLARQEAVVRVAHHRHHGAQVLRGVDLGLPVVVLIRDPVDSVASLICLAREAEIRSDWLMRELYLTADDLCWAWKRFYESIEPVLGETVLVPFEEAIQGVDSVINRVNLRWGKNFNVGRDDTAYSEHAGWHAKPNDLRAGLLRNVRAELEARIEQDSGFRDQIAECRSVYSRLRAAR